MNAEVIPAVVAAGGGSALIGSIWAYEHRRDEAMRASRVRLALRFPVGLDPLRAFAALDSLSGLPFTHELIAEVAASEGSIQHFLWVPSAVRVSAASILTGVIGSLRVSEAPPSPTEAVTLALRLFVPTPSVLAAENAVEASRALLAGLATLREDEQVIVRWALRPGAPRPEHETELQSRTEREVDRAWRRKRSAPGFTVSGLTLVRASTRARARVLAAHVESVLRSRRGLTGAIRITAGRGNRRLSAMPRTTRTSGWVSTAELLPLMGWPLGVDVPAGVEVGAARELLVPRHVGKQGRRLFIGRDALGERLVALSAEAARHHMAVVGPSGVGKSALLARCVLDDLACGYGGVVIDPKGPDLINTILERVASADASRVVVLDPAASDRAVGINVLGTGDPDLRTDVLLGVLRALSPEWGIRSETYGRLAIRTLAEVPGATLADIGRLFADSGYRRSAITRLRDPLLVGAWQRFEALSAGEQAQHIEAPMARIMALLSRPAVRSVLASPEPKLDIARLLAEHRWLLVSLSPGALGESAASLIGGALLYSVWSAIEGRAVLPPDKRHPVFLYIDELATLANGLPYSLELTAERARGLGAGLAVGLQSFARLTDSTRAALLGNIASLITFRASADEATRLARELPGLSAQDLMSLAPFEVAARIGTGAGSAISVVTGSTQALPPVTGQAEAIRERSAALYGSTPESTNPAATASDEPLSSDGVDSVGRQRRLA